MKRTSKLYNRKGYYKHKFKPLINKFYDELQYMLKNYAMSESLKDEMESLSCLYDRFQKEVRKNE